MTARFGHGRVAHGTFKALVHASRVDLCRYAYWLCGDWTTVESLIDATLAGRPYTLEAAGKDEAKPLRRLIAALHGEHARQLQGDKQDISNQRQPTGHASDKVADIELRNLRVGIASLPAKYREPLVLQSIGYSMDDIAKLLELSAAMVATRLVHARKQLRSRLNPDDAR